MKTSNKHTNLIYTSTILSVRTIKDNSIFVRKGNKMDLNLDF